MPDTSKTDEFSENFQRGGGAFSIQKFILQIFAIIDDTSVMNFTIVRSKHKARIYAVWVYLYICTSFHLVNWSYNIS